MDNSISHTKHTNMKSKIEKRTFYCKTIIYGKVVRAEFKATTSNGARIIASRTWKKPQTHIDVWEKENNA